MKEGITTDPSETDEEVINSEIDDNIILNCTHLASSSFAGDLVCLSCGKVLQSNSQLSLEPVFLDRDINKPSPVVCPARTLSHQEREELALKLLARKLVSSFALKTAYEAEALGLMRQYWTDSQSKQKYGLTGNRLLIACIFLLARRDHLAVNLGLLAASIDSTVQDCGAFFDSLVKLDPGLRSLALVSDYTERAVDLLVSHLNRLHGLQVIDRHMQGLKQRSQSIAELLQETESGSSKSAEATALAAASLALSALLLRDSLPIDLESSALPHICDISTVSFKTVKLKRAALIEKLQGRANQLLPSMFSIKATRQRRLALLLDNLDSLL